MVTSDGILEAVGQTEDAGVGSEEARPVAPTEIRQQERSKPSRALPTDRMAFPRQLDALRAFVAASGLNKKPVTLNEVSGIVNISTATLSLNNNFLVEAGLLLRTDQSHLLPVDAVYEFVRAYEWAPENAAEKLGPALRQTWFFEAIEPRLQFSPLSERLLLQYLGEAAGASPEWGERLSLLLSWLEVSGLISRDGGVVRLSNARPSSSSQTGSVSVATEAAVAPPSPRAPSPVVTSSFTHHPEGMITFAVSVRIDVTELRDWRPDRIAALFTGIAQVLAAKGDVETGTTV